MTKTVFWQEGKCHLTAWAFVGISRFHCSWSSCQCFPFYPPWILLSNFPVAVWANHYRAQLERKKLKLIDYWSGVKECLDCDPGGKAAQPWNEHMAFHSYRHGEVFKFQRSHFVFLHCFDGGISIGSKAFHIKKVAHFIGFFFFFPSPRTILRRNVWSVLWDFSVKVNHFIPERTQSVVVKNWRKSWKWITEGAGKSIIIVNLNQSLLLQKDSRLIFIGAHAYNFKKERKKKGDGPNRTMTTNFHPKWN